ncbi:ROK family transcriptional regulator [Yinghuangia sp. ASG 101]|uniref:ROK family transcriptional regulator n=1 Tax=Yinghuangia sp. ASG 101 TaxID=2896848 RepID=UPI001E345A09|nr:ROK family transcriptional regulator [Yinghuangia sp. ASG 101]UGQ13338.1 ROK family transcriptional regulator [Yinghuangia sp. ASG 101]
MSVPDSPTHLSGMRARNLVLVLDAIDRHQPVTRARLAELTGLTKTTVSAQVTQLSALGVVADAEPVKDGGRGRPGAPVSVAPGPVAALGLEVNGHYLAACVADLTRAVRVRRVLVRDNLGAAPAETIDALGRLAREVVSEAAEAGLRPVGAVAALPGVVDQTTGTVSAPNLGWHEQSVAGLLRAALPAGIPLVGVDNEANLAALGELWFGAGADFGDYIQVSGETGIGAGIVVSGELFRGAHGSAGEIGHVVVDPNGPPCQCGGHGCLEQVAGQAVLMRAAGLDDTAADDDPVAGLLRLLDAGDARAHAAVERAGHGLGTALVAAVNLLDPDTVVLSGVHAALAPWLIPHAASALEHGGSRIRGGSPAIRTSGLARGAAVLGAAGLVVARVFADPLGLAA